MMLASGSGDPTAASWSSCLHLVRLKQHDARSSRLWKVDPVDQPNTAAIEALHTPSVTLELARTKRHWPLFIRRAPRLHDIP